MAAQQPKSSHAKTDELVVFRLELVEAAVKEVSDKLDRQENIKRADLNEFRDTILLRFAEVKSDLQKQIDEKADQKQVDDLRTLIKAVGATFGSIITALVIYYLTTGSN
jgi:hypothetical protein